jgi:hypothetical protein
MFLKSKTSSIVISFLAASFLVLSALISQPCEAMGVEQEICCCCPDSDSPIQKYGGDSQECGCQISEAPSQHDIIAVNFSSDDGKQDTCPMAGEVEAIDTSENKIEGIIASGLFVSPRGQPLYILHSSFLI